MVGSRLAQLLKKRVISTDNLIEKRERRSIAEIFRDSGEPYFRKLEKAVVQEISQEEDVIIDCGGGVPLDAGNMERLKRNFTVVYLRASAEFIFENLKRTKKRPLLDVPDPQAKIKELLEKREPFYREADIVLDTNNKSIEQISEDILKILNRPE